jgi:hypothetical protein
MALVDDSGVLVDDVSVLVDSSEPPGNPEPTYSSFTEEIWESLPEVYRQYDAEQDWHFKKYISAFTCTCMLEAITLMERFWYATEEDGGPGYVPGADGNCDLANPARADADWLPWLAQVLGISLRGLSGDTPEETEAKWRQWMLDPATARRVGSKGMIIELAKAAVGGTQYLDVLPFTLSTGAPFDGTEWDVAIVYRPDEYLSDPAQMVIDAGGKPAGWLLHSRADGSTWGHVETNIGTWGDVKAKGTWQDVYRDSLS